MLGPALCAGKRIDGLIDGSIVLAFAFALRGAAEAASAAGANISGADMMVPPMIAATNVEVRNMVIIACSP